MSDIQDQIDELTRLVNQYGITIEQLRQLIEENTSDITNLKETIQNIEQNIINLGDRITNIEEGGGGSSYELPVATGTRLGGVKIGSGINVTGDGTISVASSGGSGEGGLTPGDIATLDERYLRKDTDDETTHSITVPKLVSEDFLSGIDGTGFYLLEISYPHEIRFRPEIAAYPVVIQDPGYDIVFVLPLLQLSLKVRHCLSPEQSRPPLRPDGGASLWQPQYPPWGQASAPSALRLSLSWTYWVRRE